MTGALQGFYSLFFAGSVLLVGVCCLVKPLRKIAWFVLYAALCVGLWALLCHFGPQLGLQMGFNLKTGAAAALLGLPGIAALLLINLLL